MGEMYGMNPLGSLRVNLHSGQRPRTVSADGSLAQVVSWRACKWEPVARFFTVLGMFFGFLVFRFCSFLLGVSKKQSFSLPYQV